MIVHLPANIHAPAPFFNRFEKYLVTVPVVFQSLLDSWRLPNSVLAGLNRVIAVACDLVHKHLTHMTQCGLYGYTRDDDSTLYCTVIGALLRTIRRAEALQQLRQLADAVNDGGDGFRQRVTAWVESAEATATVCTADAGRYLETASPDQILDEVVFELLQVRHVVHGVQWVVVESTPALPCECRLRS